MTPAYRYSAVVRRVIDADTIDLDVDMGFRAWRMRERFRLAGINAPEMRGPQRVAGQAAKVWLEAALPVGSAVVIETAKDPDSFGRWIATVWCDGVCLNEALVHAGHASIKSYA